MKGALYMQNYAWYYLDRDSDTCYWCYSNEMSATDFAAAVSSRIGKHISAAGTSYASNSKDLERLPLYPSIAIRYRNSPGSARGIPISAEHHIANITVKSPGI